MRSTQGYYGDPYRIPMGTDRHFDTQLPRGLGQTRVPFVNAVSPLIVFARPSADMATGLGILEAHPYADDAGYWRWSYSIAGGTATIMGALFSGMHGYRRNNGRTLPTIGWSLFGAVLPIPTAAVALVQGYGRRSR